MKVAGEATVVVVKAKNAMKVKVIVTPMTNVCRGLCAVKTIAEYKLGMNGKVKMIAVTDKVSEEENKYNDI